MTYSGMPLQSHNHHVDKWYPPRGSRFVTYGREDECWMRPLGFGTVQRELADLYDVRTAIGSLVGWSRLNPDMYDRDIRVDVSCRHSLSYFSERDVPHPNHELVTVEKHWMIVGGVAFSCWLVDMFSEADRKLLESNWIKPRTDIRELPIEFNFQRWASTQSTDVVATKRFAAHTN